MSTFELTTSAQRCDIGLGRAITRLSELGKVSIPITDTSPYDLILDIDGDLQRIQVKFTSQRPWRHRGKSESYYRTRFKKRIGIDKQKNLHHDEMKFDFAFVADADGRDWLIPRSHLNPTTDLNPNGKHAKFLLP